MSCWVVPSIAAELWGVSVEQIMFGVNQGHIPSKEEAGFFFIDVAPDSPTMEKPRVLRDPTPPTYVTVSAEEEQALAIPLDEPIEQPAPAIFVATEDDDVEEPMTADFAGYKTARELAQQTRRPPSVAA